MRMRTWLGAWLGLICALALGAPGARAQTCTIIGTAGNDVLTGTNGNDVICGLAGNDVISGLGGNDRLIGGPGDDRLDGGGGDDIVDYSTAPVGVVVNLAAGTAGGFFGPGDGNDTLISIRRVQGSDFTDFLIGDDADNVLNGGDGNDFLLGNAGLDTLRGEGGDDILMGGNGPDVLQGGSGNDMLSGGRGDDTLNGGPDSDWISYAQAPGAVTVFGLRSSGADGTDTLAGIENVEGSPFDDGLALSSPSIVRGLGGNDTLFGDPAKTTVDYSSAPAGVTVDLVAGTATGGDGNDTLSGFKNITGSPFADTLSGDNQRNTILGGGGNDALLGRAENDVLDGESGIDLANGGGGIDTCTAETLISCP